MTSRVNLRLRAAAGVACALALVPASSAASAEEGTIRRGGRGVVAQHYHIDPNGCRSGALPRIQMRQSPRLGRLSFRTQTIQIGGGLFGGPCAGRPVRATVVVYNAGGRPGRDQFSYDFRFPQAPGGAGGTKQVGVSIQ